jgi:esterase/lipase
MEKFVVGVLIGGIAGALLTANNYKMRTLVKKSQEEVQAKLDQFMDDKIEDLEKGTEKIKESVKQKAEEIMDKAEEKIDKSAQKRRTATKKGQQRRKRRTPQINPSKQKRNFVLFIDKSLP